MDNLVNKGNLDKTSLKANLDLDNKDLVNKDLEDLDNKDLANKDWEDSVNKMYK